MPRHSREDVGQLGTDPLSIREIVEEVEKDESMHTDEARGDFDIIDIVKEDISFEGEIIL